MEDRASSRKQKRDALSPPYCEIPECEYTKFFQRHRIVPGRDGGKYKLGNVISLCPNCHAEADAGLTPPEFLLSIVNERIARDEAMQQMQEGEAADGLQPSSPTEGREETGLSRLPEGEQEEGVRSESS